VGVEGVSSIGGYFCRIFSGKVSIMRDVCVVPREVYKCIYCYSGSS
jgi:hypothetical protein